ncbi:MAG: preprotein translocase subunit SecG [Bacteroidetes bacterium]|nr:preprotein translocase subunit SecG [Bacteroidota bacterium]
MDILFSVLIIVSSILLILVVYIQNPKGGGLSSDFGAAQQIGGVQKTNDFIDKTTWSLAAVIMISSIFLTIRTKTPDQKKVQEQQRKEAEKQQKQKDNKPATQPTK